MKTWYYVETFSKYDGSHLGSIGLSGGSHQNEDELWAAAKATLKLLTRNYDANVRITLEFVPDGAKFTIVPKR